VTESVLDRLRRLLVSDYGDLKRRLARRVGSTDLASEVLHETWLRLGRIDASASNAAVHNPPAYLYRVALSVVADQKLSDRRWLDKARIAQIIQGAESDLDPERITVARAELAVLSRELEAMPPLRRTVFVASRIEELPHKEIAGRHGISVRVVDRELKAAMEQFSRTLKKTATPRRGPRPRAKS
jgi:RNA polymerase sigma-70 factor (ECF subfamily)